MKIDPKYNVVAVDEVDDPNTPPLNLSLNAQARESAVLAGTEVVRL